MENAKHLTPTVLMNLSNLLNSAEFTSLNDKSHRDKSPPHTCAVLADDHTEIDGCPVRIDGFAVCTDLVGPVGPDLLRHLIIR